MAQSHVLFSIQWAAIRGVSLKLRCLPLKAIMPGRFTGILGLIFGSLFIEWYFLFLLPDQPSAVSSTIMTTNPDKTASVPESECESRWAAGISSSTTT